VLVQACNEQVVLDLEVSEKKALWLPGTVRTMLPECNSEKHQPKAWRTDFLRDRDLVAVPLANLFEAASVKPSICALSV